MTDTTPQTVAAECLEQADGDWKAAADMMEQRVREDSALRESLIEPLIAQAVWTAIRQQAHKVRSAYKAQGAEPKADNPEGIRQSARRSWYEYPIWGGKKLGDALPDEIDEAAEQYQHLADSNAHEAERMRRVRAALKVKSKPVRDQLKEDRLADLMESQ